MQREYHTAGTSAGGGRPSQLVKSAGQAGAQAFALHSGSHRQARIERMPEGGPEPKSHEGE
jgi:hypothetical protein